MNGERQLTMAEAAKYANRSEATIQKATLDGRLEYTWANCDHNDNPRKFTTASKVDAWLSTKKNSRKHLDCKKLLAAMNDAQQRWRLSDSEMARQIGISRRGLGNMKVNLGEGTLPQADKLFAILLWLDEPLEDLKL